MKYLGMILGGIFSAVGHMIAFMFKNVYIAIRRFAMDPSNKNFIWSTEAVILLGTLILIFFWLVGKYQDLIYGISGPIFYRAIPLLIPCFLGHMIYSSPIFFRNTYAKPIIQTFLNTLSGMALGQLLLFYLPRGIGLIFVLLLVILIVAVTLYYTLYLNVKTTVFSKLTAAVEEAELNTPDVESPSQSNWLLNKGKETESMDLSAIVNNERVDLYKKGCLSHLKYYSEECKRELFYTMPTKEQQSRQMVLKRNDRAQHGQFLGGTGAGKTLFATNLISQDLLNEYIGSTVIEPKGSLINRLANFLDRIDRKYYRLDPVSENSDCINPLFVPEGQDIEPMIEANVAAYHGYLGPEALQYFKSRTTQLMRVSIKALKLAYGNECGYLDLNRLIQPENDDYRAEVLSVLKSKGYDSQVSLLLQYTRNLGNPKTYEHTMSTYSSLHDYLLELTSNKYIQRIFCGKNTLNIDDAFKNGEVILVNGAYGTLQTLTYTVGRLFLNLFRASTFRRNLKEPLRAHQLTVDEIEMFADEEFSTFMEMAREFEVFVDIIHQGNEQLSDVSKRLAAMVKQNAVQKYILAGLENEDVKYYAEMIGEENKQVQSSGTDEMATSGFKTQIKEERRYRIEPSQIAKLKGYNVETGEPAECLFRPVQNNVRMDPVIGHIYPLPKILFAPLHDNVCLENKEEDLEEITCDPREDILEKIKRNAENRRNETSAKISPEPSELDISNDKQISQENHTTVRNPLWDSTDTDLNLANDDKPVTRFIPATIDDTTLKIANKIKTSAEELRKNKENGEEE
ncbi:hypothetical protein YDYSY3_39640 [Paenibacillus chitinolyticus]|nr:hypothetical protein YDYSY3_39640 [Paenibacillus chitinolyticus]